MDSAEDLTPAQLKKYLDRRVVDIDRLMKAIDVHDAGTVREITHRIKGNAALYGFAQMGLSAGKIVLQLEIHSEGWSRLQELAQELSDQVSIQISQL